MPNQRSSTAPVKRGYRLDAAWRGSGRTGGKVIGMAVAGTLLLATAANAAPSSLRAYELVSPVVKDSGNPVGHATSGVGPAWISSTGSTVVYTPQVGAVTPDALRGGQHPVVAERTSKGWISHAIAGPAAHAVLAPLSQNPTYRLPSADRRSIAFVSNLPFTSDGPLDPTGSRDGGVYLGRGTENSWLSKPDWPGSLPAPGNISAAANFRLVGASEDLGTVFFHSQAVLTEAEQQAGRAPTTQWQLYRWRNGTLDVVGRTADGTLDPGGAVAAGHPADAQSPVPIDAGLRYTNDVSDDGSSVLYVTPDPLGNQSARKPQLYLARDGKPTIALSRSVESGAPPLTPSGVIPVGIVSTTTGNGRPNGVYAVATPDQRFVFFASVDALNAAAAAAPAGAPKVYRYDTQDQTLVYEADLSADGKLNGVNVGPVAAVSDDGTRALYQTTSGAVRLWRQGASALTVATGLSVEGASTNNNYRLTADGRTVLLQSSAPLGGEPRHPAGTTQFYRWTESDQQLACVSCGTASRPATASATIRTGSQNELLPARGISSDGRSVFFQTASALADTDANAVADVYEWRDGEVRLLSGGRAGARASWIVDNSPSGDDVLFATEDGLVPNDRDGSYDIYDARVNGGIRPVDPPVQCTGDTCQGDPQGPPTLLGAGSTTTGPPSLGAKIEAPATSPTFRVRGSRGTGRSIVLRVSTTGAGRIRVTGSGLRTTSRKSTRATTYTVTVRLTSKARRTVTRRGRLAVKAAVRFTPSTGKALTSSVRLTIKRIGR